METVTLTDVIGRRQTSLLFGSLLLGACAGGAPPRPDLPESISPGWKLASINKSAPPSEVPPDGAPECWRADYAGPGTAEAWVCGYKVRGNAFDAVQRTRAEAQTVKFEEGPYLVLVKWNNVPRADLTVLVRAIQKALQPAR
jgi:hypothetical protein